MPHSLWKGAISFGLVTIPVSLYPGRSTSGDLEFHMLHRGDLSRVHYKRVDEEGHEVPYDELVRGYEYEKGQYVVVDEEELKAANVEATQTIDIMSFVDATEIDITFYDAPYFTEPTKAGRKAYALLRETLRRTGKVGIAKIVIRERQHLCAVVVDGPVLLAYTLRWPHELRDASDLDLPGDDLGAMNVSPQELKMAEQLVEAMAGKWEPDEYHDTYREDLLKVIEEKVETGKVVGVSEGARPEEGGEVVDIMTLLKRSMERQREGESGRKPEPDESPQGKARGSRQK